MESTRTSSPASPSPGSPTIAADEPCAADPARLADRVRDAVARHGWALIAGGLSDGDFEAVARELGTIELRTDLLVDPVRERARREAVRGDADGRPILYQAEGIDFHTDRPTAAWLGWRCVEQDAVGGENQLIDTRDLADHFTEHEIEGLGRIEAGYAIEGPGGSIASVQHAPLVSRGPTGLQVYYAPWRLRSPTDPPGIELLARFVRYLRDKQRHQRQVLRLEPGQCLFIDNHRMLHSRADLPADSKRHLVRLMIRATS